MARPRKPAALRELEGNRSRTPIPPELPLTGVPELPSDLDIDDVARCHFAFLSAEFGGAGVLKRADSPALAKLAALWSDFWKARAAGEYDLAVKLSAAWDRAAGHLGIQVIDRSRLITAGPQQSDPIEERFFKVTG